MEFVRPRLNGLVDTLRIKSTDFPLVARYLGERLFAERRRHSRYNWKVGMETFGSMNVPIVHTTRTASEPESLNKLNKTEDRMTETR